MLGRVCMAVLVPTPRAASSVKDAAARCCSPPSRSRPLCQASAALRMRRRACQCGRCVADRDVRQVPRCRAHVARARTQSPCMAVLVPTPCAASSVPDVATRCRFPSSRCRLLCRALPALQMHRGACRCDRCVADRGVRQVSHCRAHVARARTLPPSRRGTRIASVGGPFPLARVHVSIGAADRAFTKGCVPCDERRGNLPARAWSSLSFTAACVNWLIFFLSWCRRRRRRRHLWRRGW